MIDPVEHATATRLLRRLRIALLITVLAILLGLDLPKILSPSGSLATLPVRVAFFLTAFTVVIADAVLVAINHHWGRLLWCPIVLVAVSYVSFVFSQPQNQFASSDNWYFDVIGWLGVLLLFDRPLAWFGVYLLSAIVVTALPTFALHPVKSSGVLDLAVNAASIGGFQVCAVAATGALRRVAGMAAAAAKSAEQTVTAEAVAMRLHADGQRRYKELSATAQPLLRGLADGTMDPTDSAVQRRCMIEAFRLRRLFAESDDDVDPLLHELRATIDIAERRGLQVQLITHGRILQLPKEVRRALADAPIRALSTARGTARVVVTGTDADISISVIADNDAPIKTGIGAEGVRITSIMDGTCQWIKVSWNTSQLQQ
jgi:hypothetical protein